MDGDIMSETGSPQRRREVPYVARYRDYWLSEQAAAWLYRKLAEVADDEGAATLRRLAEAEERHASHWAKLLAKGGVENLSFPGPPRRERFLAWFARRFGVEHVLPILIRLEAADARKYIGVPEAPTKMGQEEVQHGRTLATIGKGGPSRIADVESRHRVRSGGALRAATFGVSDGLVSNLSLVIGVAGGSGDSKIVLLAGVAGLVAGAFSMGAGEWVSVRSQRELYEREIEIEAEELQAFPEEETAELAMIYRAKGIEPEAADRLAGRIMLRPSAALDTLAREELGLDPSDLVSPWIAAISSFLAFAAGAFVPVIPYIVGSGNGAFVAAIISAAIVLALVGLMISILTGRSAFVTGGRMILIGALAASATYGIGKLIGVSVT